MKKYLISLAALAVLACSAFASNTVVKKYDYKNFVGISIKNAFEVILTKGETYSISVEVPEEYVQYLSVHKKEGALEVDFDKLPRKMKTFKSAKDFVVKITMPEVYSIHLSGACILDGRDMFTSTMRDIDVECSGASKIEHLELRAPKVELDIEGASRAEIYAETGTLEMDLSGASKLTLKGEATDADFEVSGASALNAKEMSVKHLSLEQGGASNATVAIKESFKVKVGGASKCTYYSDGPIDLAVEGVTGASTFKKGTEK